MWLFDFADLHDDKLILPLSQHLDMTLDLNEEGANLAKANGEVDLHVFLLVSR